LTLVIMGLAFYDALPWGSGSPHKVLFEKYPTLITPDERALRVVPVVVLANGVFVFWQLMPAFRNNVLVSLITPWWIATTLLQVQWIRELCQSTDQAGSLAYSMILVLLMLSCYLGMILVVDARKPNFLEFWLLRASFSLNAGWLIYASAVNISIWAASLEPKLSDGAQFAVAMVSLSWVFVLTALFGLNTRRPDPLLIAPVAWLVFWVWRSSETEPTDLPAEMIKAANLAAAHVFTGVATLGVLAVVIRLYLVCLGNNIPEHYMNGGFDEAIKSFVV